MLHIVLLECALELVPQQISSLKEVQRYAGKRKKSPLEVILDQNYHGRAMLRLDSHERRGRPDIVFHSLMTLLETPLCKTGLLTVHLHLYDGRVVEVNPNVRLPRNYDRFIGLVEQLLVTGRVPPDGKPLLQISSLTLEGVLTDLRGNATNAQTILAEENGRKVTQKQLFDMLPAESGTPIILGVGAFPHGDFSPSVMKLFAERIQLDPEVMMAWHVCAEVLWMYSYRIGVMNERLEST